jgi:hypothetical protein
MPLLDSTQKAGVSFRKQVDLATAITATNSFWLLAEYGGNAPNFNINTEDDTAAIGRGTHFATNNYVVSQTSAYSLRVLGSSQMLAFAAVFGLGKSVKTTPASGAFQYVATPLNPCTDSLQLPACSVVSQACTAIDELLPGMCVGGFSLSVTNTPSRQGVQLSVDLIGTGARTLPSAVTLPSSVLNEKILTSGGLTFTFLGVTYTAGDRNFESLEFSWNNNAEPGYVGGGLDATSGAAIAGRIFQNKPTLSLSFTILVEAGGTEEAKLMAQTEGTATITLQGGLITGSTYNSCVISLPRVRFAAKPRGRVGNFQSYQCTATILYHSTNGALSITAITEVDNIGA